MLISAAAPLNFSIEQGLLDPPKYLIVDLFFANHYIALRS